MKRHRRPIFLLALTLIVSATAIAVYMSGGVET